VRVYRLRSMGLRSERSALTRGVARVALLPPAAFAVHQLRYVLAFGTNAGLELQRQGHSYLHSFVPWIVVLIALVAGGFLRSLGKAFAGHTSLSRFSLSFSALWLVCSAALVGIYVGQELLEGFVLTGHPAGLVGVFGYGGWWSIPVALCVGLVLAAVFHGARWVLDAVARRHGARRLVRNDAVTAIRATRDALLPRLAPLAGGCSGRGPPL
jgi:hypothetical protein